MTTQHDTSVPATTEGALSHGVNRLLVDASAVRHAAGPIHMVRAWQALLASVAETTVRTVGVGIARAEDGETRILLSDAAAEVLALAVTERELEDER